MAAVAPPYQSSPHVHHQLQAMPLFDLFLDLPHPAAAKGSPPPFISRSPSTSAEMEKELNANLSRIGRFAFPEFDDASSQTINRETTLNRFSLYAMQTKAFQHYTFSLQLQSGVRIHGHVRRYHPAHPGVKSRYDVGRRGERALVIMTRANGGDLVYSAILKTLDAIMCQNLALEAKLLPHPKGAEQWFLDRIFDQHRHMCNVFATLPQQDRKPMVLTVDSLEAGVKQIPLIEQDDNSKFLIPTSLLAPTSPMESVTASSILPLLRVLGVQNTLRLLSALLSESRILLISCSPTRLAQCARSALSILAQGLLNWQHLYIPVLPPHLFQYLGAPVPYLIGMLDTLVPRLDQGRADGLGEMVIINLDTAQMETRGINPGDVARRIPDLFRSAMADQGVPVNSMSAPEMLAQDLIDLLKVDKRTLHGESALTNVSETAAKASKAVKAGLSMLKQQGKKFLKNRSSSNVSSGSTGSDDELEVGAAEASGPDSTSPQVMVLPDFIYTQGAQNEFAEEEARIAFSSFFLSLFGNMRWYLSANPGQLPQLDRQRFLQQKRAMGEGEHTPIWPMLENFCNTQMLEEFAKDRVEEVRTRQPVTSDSPLFSQCSNYHRLHNVDFSAISIRRVARQVAQNSPSRIVLQTQARRTTMLLTSNKTFDGDYNQAVAQLVEECRESSSVLFDVMSVIWVRLRDSKGLHWKHGFQALQILRNLLYHGPLAAIAEATDGLDKIRLMKFYNDNMRSQICTQIRQVALQVYNLLVDRAKLFAIRRLCINKRRLLRKEDNMRYVKDTRMRVTTPFIAIHKAFNPSTAKVSPMPGGETPKVPFAAEQDLLGFGAPNATTPVAQAPAQSNVANDLVGLFVTNVSLSTPANATTASNPFFSASQSPAASLSATPAHSVTASLAVTPGSVNPLFPVQPSVVPFVATPQYQQQSQLSVPTPQQYVSPGPVQVMHAAQGQPNQQPYPVQGQPAYPSAPQQSQFPVQGYPPAPQLGYPPAAQYQQQGQPPVPQQPIYSPQPYYPQQTQTYPYQAQQVPAQQQPAKPNVSQFDPLK